MNEKEKLILELIRKNPFITQSKLAEELDLSRSAVAGYISSLTKQGKIIGRAYVLPEPSRIMCIGGANVDRKAQAQSSVQFGTSNPVTITQSCGGVARNVAENLGRLGSSVSLLTVVGDDQEGEWLLSITSPYVDTSQTMKVEKMNTGTYTAVLDHDGEMVIALADMAIYDTVSQDFIQKRWSHISSASMVLLDTNFPSDVLQMVIERCYQEKIPLCIAPVSAPKVKKLPANLNGVTWLIANKDEAMTLAGLESGNVEEACEKILTLGAENVIITQGEKGIVYKNKKGEHGTISAPKLKVIDATGAGDSFTSGFLYGMNNGESFEKACKLGMSCSIIALQTKETVCTQLNEHLLNQTYKQYFSEEA
ncbi:carbohydrate kinase [Thermaerobacillus caldiproteolyticus]|uniref:Pseudouridine kinase n=1 Tax=Thermaerobacillus caldiproteolyticus TaxID=247480 RepID=A0A7W0C0H1_9BACL|nr:carbohydrate kinase [Anoxybacillus caldiproteolyticus]MBA2875289.1 pseudouridine kinase [Anoxybacillus caldiproteolyticus]